MAMNSSTLAGAMKTKLLAAGFSYGDDQVDDALQAIAEAVVEHITANAEVSSGIAVSVDTETGAGNTTGAGSIT